VSGPCECRHCQPTTPAAVTSAVPEPIELPARPTPIRVHTQDFPPMDCTLHPDGTLTRTGVNGEPQRNLMSFADMRERGWAMACIEFNPPPLPEEPEPEPVPVAPEPVQDAIPLDIA
jgi:hypothetical protein